MASNKTKMKYAIGIMWKANEIIWVTDISWSPKIFKWEKEKKPYLFENKNMANDTAFAMVVNGFNAFVVTIPDYFWDSIKNGTWEDEDE